MIRRQPLFAALLFLQSAALGASQPETDSIVSIEEEVPPEVMDSDRVARTDRAMSRVIELSEPFLDDREFAGQQKPFGGDFALSVGPDMGWTGPGTSIQDLTLWPWASITKQVVATMIMQDVERGRIVLDAPVIAYMRIPPAGDVKPPTIRQLMQHRSGLRNPEDSPAGEDGFSQFYASGMGSKERAEACLVDRGEPSTDRWIYNNCDYIVLGAVLEAVGKKPFEQLFDERIGEPAAIEGVVLWEPGDERKWIGGSKLKVTEPIAGYGTSGALMGSTADLARFLRALVDGRLLGAEAREEMWRGDPSLGYMALGQWSFEAPLAGCDGPVRIVERRGGIGRFQARTFIVPDARFFLAFVGYAPDFEFGEIWTGEGFAYRALSLAYCGEQE